MMKHGTRWMVVVMMMLVMVGGGGCTTLGESAHQVVSGVLEVLEVCHGEDVSQDDRRGDSRVD